MALPEDLDELHEHLPVGLERGGHDVLAGTVMAAPDRAELDARHAGPLEVDDVAGSVAPDADGVAVIVSRGDLAQGLDVRVRAGDVGRLAAEQDLDLGGEGHRGGLGDGLPWGLAREGAGVEGRSGEGRVGEGGRSRWVAAPLKKKTQRSYHVR